MNRTKCQVWGPGSTADRGALPILASFTQLDWGKDGLTMLGVPICRKGDSGSARLALTDYVDVISVFCSVLGDVGELLSLWKKGG